MYAPIYQTLGCGWCNSLNLNLLKQALTNSYQAKQEVMATNKSTTWRKCIGAAATIPYEAIVEIYGAVGRLKVMHKE